MQVGKARYWGWNGNGQLGDGTRTDCTAPVDTTFVSATYIYGNAAHKHAVTSLSTGESYTYDANGNMTQRIEGGLTYTQTFDAENRLISVTVNSQTTSFLYDGDGNLVKKTKPDGSKTIYPSTGLRAGAGGGVYEVDKTSAGGVTRTITYYPADGAMRINSTLYYVLKDHLGLASVVTDASGTPSVPLRGDLSPKSARESKNNYPEFLLRIWGRGYRKSRRRAAGGGCEQGYCEASLWDYPFGDHAPQLTCRLHSQTSSH